MAMRSHRTPYDDTDDTTELEEHILQLLEDAEISTKINDKIMVLVRRGLDLKHAGEPDDEDARENAQIKHNQALEDARRSTPRESHQWGYDSPADDDYGND